MRWGRESDGECSRRRVLDKGLDLLNIIARAKRWTIRDMYSKWSVRPFSTCFVVNDPSDYVLGIRAHIELFQVIADSFELDA